MKAMHKTSRGTGFRGVLNYALEDGKGVVIGGNMAGRDAASLAAEFGISRRQRPDIEKPVWHQALRLPKGEKLSNEQWCEIADAYMKKMALARIINACTSLKTTQTASTSISRQAGLRLMENFITGRTRT